MPGHFIIFRAPRDDLASGGTWADVDGDRHFSTAFYADLLHTLGVTQVSQTHCAPSHHRIGGEQKSVGRHVLSDGSCRSLLPQVLRLTPPAHADATDAVNDAVAAAFSARGIGVEDLCGSDACDRRGELSLRALDRFMTLARSTGPGAGGPLALQCGGTVGRDAGRAATLIAAWMLRGGRFGASAAEALAWLRIAVPGPAFSLEPALLRAAARVTAPPRRTPPRSVSFHEGAAVADARPPPARCASLSEEEMAALAAEPVGGGFGAPPAASRAGPPARRPLLRTQSEFAAAALRRLALPARPAPGSAADGRVAFCVE